MPHFNISLSQDGKLLRIEAETGKAADQLHEILDVVERIGIERRFSWGIGYGGTYILSVYLSSLQLDIKQTDD